MALTRRQERAIGALLVSNTLYEAARRADVPVRTLRRWMRQPEFVAAYQEALGRVREATINQAQAVLRVALSAAAKDCRLEDLDQRFRAWSTVLGEGLAGVAVADHGRRIRDLERAQGPEQGPPPGGSAETDGGTREARRRRR